MSINRKFPFALVFMLSSTAQAGDRTVLEPLNQQVALAGTLYEVHGYGPPGYGENKKVDTPITYWVLALPNPVNTVCTPERPEWIADDCKETNQLKLFFPDPPAGVKLEIKAKSMRNRKVVATGILHRADTAGEITPIYMDIVQLRLVRSWPKNTTRPARSEKMHHR